MIRYRHQESSEKFKELSDKAKKKLRDWWQPSAQDIIYYQNADGNDQIQLYAQYDGKNIWIDDDNPKIIHANVAKITKGNYKTEIMDFTLYPLLSIGQLFEFLENFSDNITAVKDSDNLWLVKVKFNMEFIESKDQRLYNALWSVAKTILES